MTVSFKENLRVKEVADEKQVAPVSALGRWWPILLIMLAGLALRLYKIGDHGFFIDEVYTALVVNGKADPELIQFDSIRPLYFELMKYWTLVRQDEAWMRLFSTIFGTANIFLVYQLGKTVAGKTNGHLAGMAAAVFMALSPMEVHYSQQARMYTLGSFFALCGSISLMDAFESGRKISLCAWAASRAMMILTLPLTAVLIGIDIVLAWMQPQRKKFLVHMVAWLCAVGLLWSPVLKIMWGLNSSSPYDEWRATLPIPLITDFTTMILNFTSSAIPLQEWKGPPVQDWAQAIYVVVFAAVLALGVGASKNKSAVLWGLVPLFAFFAVSVLAKPLLITRYCMFTAPFIFVVAACGFATLWKTYKPVAIFAQLIFAIAIGANLNYFYNHPVHEDWRAVSNYVMANEKPGDEIAVWNYHCQYSFPMYYKGKNHICDIKIMVRDIGDLSKGSYVDFQNSKPLPGQRIMLVTRIPALGWREAHKHYQVFLESLDKQFKIHHKEKIGMMNVFEVTLL